MKLTYLGHSAFEFSIDGNNILVDPFLSQNSVYVPNNIKDIFVTHGHADHFGDSIELSKNFNAKITAIFELANYSLQKGAIASGVSLGAKLKYSWGWAVFVPAFHSSSTSEGFFAGCPAGIVFDIGGIRIFHAGDTCLNSEMKVVKEVYAPQIALLPIGGTYTMDIDQAVIAAEWLGVSKVIPMHYNTFPAISVDPSIFKDLLSDKGIEAIILEKNQFIEF